MHGKQEGARRFGLRPDVVATVEGDGAVILDLETKYFYELNSSAWAVTQMFETGATLEEVQSTCEQWGVDPAGAAEAEQLAKQLIDEHLVEPIDEPSNGAPVAHFDGEWVSPRLDKQPAPLQSVIVNAFDPSLPLAE